MKSNIANILVKSIKSLAWCIYNSFHELNSDLKNVLTKLTNALGRKMKNDSILDRLISIICNGRAGNCSQNNHKLKPEKHGIAHSNNKHGMKRKVKFWCFSKLKGETCYFTYIKFMTLLMNILAPIVDNLFSLHVFAD